MRPASTNRETAAGSERQVFFVSYNVFKHHFDGNLHHDQTCREWCSYDISGMN